METEADDYKLNSEGHQQSLHASLIDNKQVALILTNKLTNQRYSSYLTLQGLRKLCKVFDQIKSIQEALTLLKNTIEAGRIALTEESNELILLNFDIELASGKFPEFDVNLTLESNNTNNNNQDQLPATFDYQGNSEAEAKYGNNTKNTTEYNKPQIQTNYKPPIVQLEYIEPILQVHYPDGTTKSTALPPRIQDSNGAKMNISEEQFKAIQEQMNRNTHSVVKNFSPLKNNTNLNNRANSVTKKNTSMYSTQTTPHSMNNTMNLKNPFNTNVVRPAMKNMNNINQVRSAFEVNPNNNFNNTFGGKISSDYSSMTVKQNRPNNFANTGYMFQKPNPTLGNSYNNNITSYLNSQYNTQTFSMRNNNLIEERRPRMTNNNNNQRNTSRSLSTPSHDNFNKFNPNKNYEIYGSDNQVNYNYQSNQYYQQNNFNKNPTDRKVGQPVVNQGLNYSQNQLNYSYNQEQRPTGNIIQQTKPVSNSAAMQQSQELIKLHQKRLQEVQKQLALIQQQQQKLQEQQKQLIYQQQMQRQIIQNQTLGNKAQTQIYSQSRQQYNIRPTQTSMTNPPFAHHSSQEIKQTKTVFNPKPTQNPPFRTQVSTPMSMATPTLTNYQSIAQNQYMQSNYYQNQNKASSNNIDNDEITEQQIALAQMASMQNQVNPAYQNLKAITLEQKREENEEEQQQNQEQEQEQAEAEAEAQQQQEEEELNIEALFMTEEGRIIFRNGLCRGIVHKYAEIDDVISKIQDILCKGVKLELVYRAFDMGDKASIFHEKCDKLPMSLVLIETDKDIRFGGFTTKSWEGNNIKKKDKNAFVFSLEKNKIFDIIKDEPAIGCYPKFGPVFFGCQIRIYDEFFSKGGTTCHKGLNYDTKEDYELNNGEQKYLVKDIEVYNIETIDV